jgi:hypothetical protein
MQRPGLPDLRSFYIAIIGSNGHANRTRGCRQSGHGKLARSHFLQLARFLSSLPALAISEASD